MLHGLGCIYMTDWTQWEGYNYILIVPYQCNICITQERNPYFFVVQQSKSCLAHLILNNKLTSTRQHNKYLLEYLGYTFRPANVSSPGLDRNTSQVLFRYWDPNIFTVVKVYKN